MNRRQLLSFIAEGSAAGEPVVMVTYLGADLKAEKVAVSRSGSVFGSIDDPKVFREAVAYAERLFSSRKNAEVVEIVDEGGRASKVILEVVRRKPSLIVFGAGHVGQAVALMGAMVGYRVTVVDDREEFLSRKRLPDPRIQLETRRFEDAVRPDELSSSSAVVIVTRGHQFDEICLKGVIGSRAGYIGMIGSRRRVLSVFRKLKEEGAVEADLDRVHAPIGLEIGARSPQEIAVAIIAEIIQVMNVGGYTSKG
ncbi:MAG TPA: XdhC family protein [Blastocatellia bacterium]|nr:XdhC family protein [Blastocatellia bacterium]